MSRPLKHLRFFDLPMIIGGVFSPVMLAHTQVVNRSLETFSPLKIFWAKVIIQASRSHYKYLYLGRFFLFQATCFAINLLLLLISRICFSRNWWTNNFMAVSKSLNPTFIALKILYSQVCGIFLCFSKQNHTIYWNVFWFLKINHSKRLF